MASRINEHAAKDLCLGADPSQLVLFTTEIPPSLENTERGTATFWRGNHD